MSGKSKACLNEESKSSQYAEIPRPVSTRPNSARPQTSGGTRMHLTNYDSVSIQAPEQPINSASVIQREVCNDSLLRILSARAVQTNSDAILLSEQGNAEGIANLILSGFDISKCRGMNGYSPFHYAASRGHTSVVAVLVKSNLLLSATNDLGETALHLASYSGHILIVEQLLDYGANIDRTNEYGESPLFYAARKSMPAIVRMLIQRGADPNIKDKYEEMAIDHAPDEPTRNAFKVFTNQQSLNQTHTYALAHDTLLRIFGYLNAREVSRSACVSGKWHRVSESEVLWSRLGIRRWECALQSALGFGLAPSSLFRPSNKRATSFKEKDSATAASVLPPRPLSRPPSK